MCTKQKRFSWLFLQSFISQVMAPHIPSFTKPETWESVIPNSSPPYPPHPISHPVLLILPLNTSEIECVSPFPYGLPSPGHLDYCSGRLTTLPYVQACPASPFFTFGQRNRLKQIVIVKHLLRIPQWLFVALWIILNMS